MPEIKKILGSVAISKKIIDELKVEAKNIAGYKKKIDEYMGQDVTSFLEVILFGAILLDASDIHIEPQEQNARLRIRLDGILQDVV